MGARKLTMFTDGMTGAQAGKVQTGREKLARLVHAQDDAPESLKRRSGQAVAGSSRTRGGDQQQRRRNGARRKR